MQSSVDAEQVVLDRASKRRAVREEIPSGQQDLAAWMCSKQLELRDALEMVRGRDCQGVGAIDGQTALSRWNLSRPWFQTW